MTVCQALCKELLIRSGYSGPSQVAQSEGRVIFQKMLFGGRVSVSQGERRTFGRVAELLAFLIQRNE